MYKKLYSYITDALVGSKIPGEQTYWGPWIYGENPEYCELCQCFHGKSFEGQVETTSLVIPQ